MATRWENVPGLNEDVVRRTAEDVGKVKKRLGVDSSNLKGGAREAVREAGGRAASRLGTRAGLLGGALQVGYDTGRAIDETTGVGKKLVDKTVGPAIDKMAAGEDRVELSKESKERIARGDLESKEAKQEVKPVKRKQFSKVGTGETENRRAYEEGEGEDGMRRGGSVKKYAKGGSASSRGDGCAQRGKTKGRYL